MRRRSLGLFGYYGNTNTGDEAILRVIAEQLHRRGRSDELVVFSDDPEDTRSLHHVDAVGAVLPASAHDWIVGCLGRSRSSFFEALRTYRGLNIAIFGGGGLLFDSANGNPWLFRNLRRLELLKSRGVGVAVFAVGVGPLYREDSRRQIGETLGDVDLITVRDPESAELLIDCGLSEDRIHIAADLVWALEPSPDARVEPLRLQAGCRTRDRRAIAVCLRGEHAADPVYVRAWTGALQVALDETDADLWFLPMQTGGGCDDRYGHRIVAQSLNRRDRIRLVETRCDPADWAGWMRSCDLVFSERLHGAVLGMRAGVPAIGLAYMPKVARVFREVGHEDWLVDGRELSAEALVRAFRAAWEKRLAGAEHLQELLPRLGASALSHFDWLEAAFPRKVDC